MIFRLLMISLVMLGIGVWMLAPTWNTGEQETCSIERLYNGDQPESNWVKIRGRLWWEESAVEETSFGSIDTYFVPLVPSSFKAGKPVRVFVRISSFEAENLDEYATIEGLVQPMGLPLDLRSIFQSEGPQPAKNALYIHHGTDPKMQRQFAQVLAVIGAVGLAGCFLMMKFGGGSSETTSYHSPARARTLDEISQDTVSEQRVLEQEQQRQSEVDQWMRERGIKTDEVAAESDGARDAEPTYTG